MKKLIVVAAAIVLLVAGIVRVELVAQAQREAVSNAENGAVENSARAEKRKAMIDAARGTYEAVASLYELGTETSNTLYVWSSYLRTAQGRAADSKQLVAQACQEHLDRMQSLHGKVAALNKQGARGGEAEKLYATQFYVAEAELLLLEAKDSAGVELTPGRNSRNQ